MIGALAYQMAAQGLAVEPAAILDSTAVEVDSSLEVM